jgi:hypothetical protein
MKAVAAAVFLLNVTLATSGAIDLRARSTSSSKQFTIYCENAALRAQITTFVEEVKRGVLSVLGQPDRWRIPIVVAVEHSLRPRPVSVRFAETPDGPTIQLHASYGDDPAADPLQRHLIRAILLDFIYRDRARPEAGQPYVEAPWWFIAGTLETLRRRDQGIPADLYRRLVETNKLPSIEQFLAGRGDELGGTAAAFDAACALAFVQLLREQTDGPARLATLLRTWPDEHRDPILALNRAFPALGAGTEGLQRWWTLNFARFAASDRYRGLSAEDTDRELQALLEFDIVRDKAGSTERFALGQWREFMKLPGARAALTTQHRQIVALATRANALLRPVVAGYEEIFARLARGSTRGLAERIHKVEIYRTTVLQRSSDIAYYLNWFEATQLGVRSQAFDEYLRRARQAESTPALGTTGKAIAEYLDELEKEF